MSWRAQKPWWITYTTSTKVIRQLVNRVKDGERTAYIVMVSKHKTPPFARLVRLRFCFEVLMKEDNTAISSLAIYAGCRLADRGTTEIG